jgi:EpsI family protein
MRKLAAYAPALELVVGCGLIGSATRQRSVPVSAPLKTLLAPIPGYSVTDLTVGDEERRIAGMSDYVSRVYRRDSLLAFTTYVGYYDHQTQGKSMHSPKNCLPGAGWEILTGGTRVISSGGAAHAVNRYVLKNGTALAVVYYWYQGRGRIVASEYAVKWNLLRDAGLRGHTEEALVRVVVPVASPRDLQGASRAEQAYPDASATGEAIASRLMREMTAALPGTGAGPSRQQATST